MLPNGALHVEADRFGSGSRLRMSGLLERSPRTGLCFGFAEAENYALCYTLPFQPYVQTLSIGRGTQATAG